MTNRRGAYSLFAAFAEKPMLKGFLWSLSFHAIFVVLLFALTGEGRKDFMPITVLLAGDLPGEADGDGQGSLPRPGSRKATKAKDNHRSSQHETPEAGIAPSPEKALSYTDTKETTSSPDLHDGISMLRSLDHGKGFEGEQVASARQGSGGEGQDGKMGPGGGGSGITSGTGSGLGPGHGTGTGGNASYLSVNFGYIRDRILNGLTYPAQARRMGWKGRVTISFVISDDGRVENIKVLESSGHGILDENAIRTIKYCQPFPRPPVRAEVIIPIVYRIG